MTSVEFTEWQAYYLLEPFGAGVADLRHGAGMAMLANAHFGGKEKTYGADEFMLGDTGQEMESAEPVLLDDDVAQSNLIRASLFGLPPKEPVA